MRWLDSLIAEEWKHETARTVETFYLNSTLNFVIPPVLVFQLEVYYKVDRLLTGLTVQQKGTTARWHSNKTSLFHLCSRYHHAVDQFTLISYNCRIMKI